MMFPGATADRAAADYVVVGAPLDVSTTFRPGTRFGPDRIRRFAGSFEDYDHRTDRRFSDLAVHDAGDVRAWDDAADYLDYLAATLRDVDAVPLLLGGEHTVSVAGVRAVDPDLFVCLDAHLDLRESFDDNPLSHACVTRRALETADRAVLVGARSGSEAGWERATADDVTVVAPETVRREGVGAVADAVGAAAEAAGDSPAPTTYCSVDVDAADPGVAPGTGTMEPGGLSAREMRTVVRTLAPGADGFDLVEVNDRDDGQAATLGGALVRDFAFAHAAAPSAADP